MSTKDLKKLFYYISAILFLIWLLPPVSYLKKRVFFPTAFMQEETGDALYSWVPINRISANLQRAVVVSEDGRFYEHHGFDFQEFQKAFNENWEKSLTSRGFSTITMQLARNLYLTSNRTIVRKLIELVIAFELELSLPKQRILELYLNIAEWGEGIYGAEAASRYYFNKPASQLNFYEASFLAAILPSPKRWGHWPPLPFVQQRMNIIRNRL